jgi:tRNA threonylcarbamoyladenosine biosynthesis protein TsaB
VNLLAFDTSTEHLSLALIKGEASYVFQVNAGQTHSQVILPQIDSLLKQANLQLGDLHGLAFGAGPGSFTGVRIAAGVAQGLGLGANLPVLGVCTLLALAQASGANKVIACLDARMGEVYHAAYEKVGAQWQTLSEPTVCKPEAAPILLGTGWTGVGSGWQAYPVALAAVYSGQLVATQPDCLPSAMAILALSQADFAAGQALPAGSAMPIYVRNRVALKTAERELGKSL